jgi:hypothetical protein
MHLKIKMTKKNEWMILSTLPKDFDTKDYFGFVYEILERGTHKSYIGIKQFWSQKTLRPLKGKKNKRHSLIESDWKTYNSSSIIIQEKIKNDPYSYTKCIMYLAKTKTDLKAMEAYLQLKYYFEGKWNLLYNECINLRLRIRKE